MSDRGFVPEGQYGPPGGNLSSLIQRTRDQVATYLGQARTRQRRLLNVAIVAGALATALAGAPEQAATEYSTCVEQASFI